jgi:hypothetical protein
MTEIYEPLRKDLPLLSELGVKPFKATHGVKTFIGKIQLANSAYVKVWVTAMPAQFWHFEIYCAEFERVYQVTTASGSLSEYWGSAKMMAEGTFAVDGISERCN